MWIRWISVSASSLWSSLCGRRFCDPVRFFSSLAAWGGSVYVAWHFRAPQCSSFSDSSLRRFVVNLGSFIWFNLPLTYSNSAVTNWYGRTRRRQLSRRCLTDLKYDSTEAFVRQIGSISSHSERATLGTSIANRSTFSWKMDDHIGYRCIISLITWKHCGDRVEYSPYKSSSWLAETSAMDLANTAVYGDFFSRVFTSVNWMVTLWISFSIASPASVSSSTCASLPDTEHSRYSLASRMAGVSCSLVKTWNTSVYNVVAVLIAVVHSLSAQQSRKSPAKLRNCRRIWRTIPANSHYN